LACKKLLSSQTNVRFISVLSKLPGVIHDGSVATVIVALSNDNHCKTSGVFVFNNDEIGVDFDIFVDDDKVAIRVVVNEIDDRCVESLSKTDD